jgi:hypothetical protein
MKTVENEAMKSRLDEHGAPVGRPFVHADPGDHREVSGDQREDAG